VKKLYSNCKRLEIRLFIDLWKKRHVSITESLYEKICVNYSIWEANSGTKCLILGISTCWWLKQESYDSVLRISMSVPGFSRKCNQRQDQMKRLLNATISGKVLSFHSPPIIAKRQLWKQGLSNRNNELSISADFHTRFECTKIIQFWSSLSFKTVPVL
jgi:hypothetical protein